MEFADCSDDSLAWSNASSEKSSNNSVISNMELNNYESGSEYKKKVHDEVFNDSEGKKHKKKAKKRKRDEDLSENDDYRSAKKKNIKSEPESDRDKSENEIAQSDSYINLRVKQENVSDPDEIKSKKKKKHKKVKKEIEDESELLNDTEDNQVNNTSEVSALEDTIKKKKKKKKAKYSDTEEGREINNIENSYTTENTEKYENGHYDEVINEKRTRVMSSTVIENDLNKSKIDESIINNISVIPSKVPKKTTRISDRLKFEDDEDINNLESVHEPDSGILSCKEVKTFLKRNPTLLPLKSFAPFNTDDDDIWVIKCPTEININDFKNVNLLLDGKSKIKVAGQTYDGTIDETDSKMPIVTYSKKKVFLKNLSVLRTITFRKRIPVPHIQDDNVVMHNHPSFISLPDTKCRHPLFGTNYKKAIKISKSVGERLAESELQPDIKEQDTHKIKRKKHKKENHKIEKESEVETSINVKDEPEVPIKKRKRKHKNEEESYVKPAKKIKLEQDPTAWESEKAIEENLFNF